MKASHIFSENGDIKFFPKWVSPMQNGVAKQKPRGGAETDHRSPRHQYNLQQQSLGVNHNKVQPAQDLSLRPERPKARQYSPNNPLPPPPPSQQQSVPNQLSSEYLAMFKQLQKAGNNANYGKPVVDVQESSDALKKILKIVDDPSFVPPTVHQPSHQHQQPIKPLQQNMADIPNSIQHLLSHHQTRDWRLPKYHYLDSQGGTIICTVVCGNNKEFQGAPSFTNEQAAENAATIALQCLAMDDQRGMMRGPEQRIHSLGGMLMAPGPHASKRHIPTSYPLNSRLAVGWAREPPVTLPQPPINWYQNKSFQTGTGPYHPLPSSPAQRFQQPQGHLGPHAAHGPVPPFTQVPVGLRPAFIPMQVLSRVRQQQPSAIPPHQAPTPAHSQRLPSPRQAPVYQPQRTAKKETSGHKESKTSSGRSSTRPPRTRLAANFSKPLKFDSPSESSQDTS